MEKHSLKIKKSARYFVSGTPGPSIKKVWFICHGYGHLGNYFLRKFEELNDSTTLFVSCEGLSRFYVSGFSGRVGASWMTKEDRTEDIEDYIGYLNAVYDKIMNMQTTPVHITAFGFSQGTATICRWLEAGSHRVDQLVVWAGGIPDDIDLVVKRDRFNSFRKVLVVGTQDEFIKETEITSLCNRLDNDGIKKEVIRFEGKHELHEETLRQLLVI